MRVCATALALAAQLFVGGAAAQGFDHEHKAWTALLAKHVVLIDGGKASQVRYADFQKDRSRLKAYTAALSAVSEQEFRGWSRDQRLAFLLNAYNAHMVELVLTRYPGIQSVWDFGKLFNNPFKRRFFTLLGREFTLDMIEHDTIRARGAYDDPRIHMAVNCASIGCPALRPEAFVAEKLDAQLEDSVQRFLSDRSRNRADTEALRVSKIFDWYGDDFAAKSGSVMNWLARYADQFTADPALQRAVREAKLPLRFLDYDWSLNARRS